MKLIMVKRAVKYYAAVEKIEGSLYVQIRKDLWDIRKNINSKARGRTVCVACYRLREETCAHVQALWKGVQKRPCHPVTSYF